jgi:serine protease inhibitor
MQKRKFLIIIIILLVVLVHSSVFGYNDDNTHRFVKGNTVFCFELYQKLKKTEGNLFFSPYSISTAMGLTYAGAKGETEKEIAKTLHFALDKGIVFSELKEIQSRLNSLSVDGYVQLSIANSLWSQKENQYLNSFIELNDNYFGSEIENVDFINNAKDAILSINTWVRENTNNKIDGLLQPESDTGLTKIFLCNVIYMKGVWANKFNVEDTKPSSFYVTPLKRVKVPMMNQTGAFRYKDFRSFRAIELPYITGKTSYENVNDLSMIIFLPESNRGLSKLENILNQQNISQWIHELMKKSFNPVKVQLPKFTSTLEFELSTILSDMGMPSAFGDGADFSGIFEKKDVFINRVVHKTYIDINEEGTEAAAVTEEEFTLGGPVREPQIIKFYADHPFVFLVLDNKSGSILFVGRVTDPSK